MGRTAREPIRATPSAARRLALTKQGLAGPLPRRRGPAQILSVVRDLAFVQWDPVEVVAPSHRLSLWSRLGDFRPEDLEDLLGRDRRLILHWTPIASLVLTEDFPVYHSLMSRYPASMSRSWGAQGEHARAFLAGHADLARRLLRELAGGPRTVSEFADHRRDPGRAEWMPSSDVAQLLYHLSMSGRAMVVGHRENQNLWGLPEEFLPKGIDRTVLSPAELERRTAERAVRSLGTASPREILLYYVRGRYQDLPDALSGLEAEGILRRVVVDGWGPRDVRYVHADDVATLQELASGPFDSRISLLPPFDTLINSTARAARIFGFQYVREQFLPAHRRRYGTWVMPIVGGDRLIGRIDPRLDRSSGTLVINAVHAEPGAPVGREFGGELDERIHSLAKFVGAKDVRYSERVPPGWRSSLR